MADSEGSTDSPREHGGKDPGALAQQAERSPAMGAVGRPGVDLLTSEPEFPKDIPAEMWPGSWTAEPRVQGQGLGCCHQ